MSRLRDVVPIMMRVLCQRVGKGTAFASPMLWWLMALLLLGAINSARVSSRALAGTAQLVVIHELLDARPTCSQHRLGQLQSMLHTAIGMDAKNLTAQRAMAWVYWLNGDDANSLGYWMAGGLRAGDLIGFGHRARLAGRQSEAFRWFLLAEMADPADPTLWREVGLLCRQDPLADSICDRFLDNNDQNWIVDPSFLGDGHEAWFSDPPSASYDFGVPCPGLPSIRCATIKIDDDIPQHGASWQQQLYLRPGQLYRFQAWIKTEADAATEWRPVYYGGRITGKDQGRWPGDQFGSRDWRLWEHTFEAEEFDDDVVYLHPVILKGRGQAWFFGVSLTAIENDGS